MKSIFPIFLVAISLAVFFIFVRPLYGDVAILRADIGAYTTALDNSKSLQETRDALLETYQNIPAVDKERLLQFLPSSVNNIGLILELEKLAKDHNLTIGDIRFETQSVTEAEKKTSSVTIKANDPSANRTFGVFPFEFSVSGTYDNFTLFLKDVEKNLRLVDVKSISFTVPQRPTTKNPETEDTSHIYNYSLKIETYWLK